MVDGGTEGVGVVPVEGNGRSGGYGGVVTEGSLIFADINLVKGHGSSCRFSRHAFNLFDRVCVVVIALVG